MASQKAKSFAKTMTKDANIGNIDGYKKKIYRVF